MKKKNTTEFEKKIRDFRILGVRNKESVYVTKTKKVLEIRTNRVNAHVFLSDIL